jgi:inner membrane protein
MNPITHALVGWSLATVAPGLSRAEKIWIVGAAVAPDVDGLGLVAELATRNSDAPLLWWSQYHHVLAHNVLFALLLTGAAAAIFRRMLVTILVLASVGLHLLGDLVGSRGPDGYPWPLSPLWPFSTDPVWVVSWQWKLNAWPNLVLTLVLLAYTFWFARRFGSSPLELVSPRANHDFVAALRRRFPFDQS